MCLFFLLLSYMFSSWFLLTYWLSLDDDSEHGFCMFVDKLTGKLSKRFIACWVLFFPIISPFVGFFVLSKILRLLLVKFVYLWKLAIFGEEREVKHCPSTHPVNCSICKESERLKTANE